MKTKKKLECLQQLQFQRGNISEMAQKLYLPRTEQDEIWVQEYSIKSKIVDNTK